MKKECSAGYDCDACKPEISLRDWFAGMAMQAFITCPDALEGQGGIVALAYKTADAMLKEREK